MPRYKVIITGEIELEKEEDTLTVENNLFDKVDLEELQIEWYEIE